jgi:predicted enzyme involved in methoxymalonyl-ACP biosynthesis
MISVIVCRKDGRDWEIDTWLMSCRVLGRGVEEAVLQEIIRQAVASGAVSLTGRYIPTDRNAVVAEHYAKLGFTLLETQADGSTVWQLGLEGMQRVPVHMKIQHNA